MQMSSCYNYFDNLKSLSFLMPYEVCIDTVRSLATLPTLGILSASHDGWVSFFLYFRMFFKTFWVKKAIYFLYKKGQLFICLFMLQNVPVNMLVHNMLVYYNKLIQCSNLYVIYMLLQIYNITHQCIQGKNLLKPWIRLSFLLFLYSYLWCYKFIFPFFSWISLIPKCCGTCLLTAPSGYGH